MNKEEKTFLKKWWEMKSPKELEKEKIHKFFADIYGIIMIILVVMSFLYALIG